MEDGEQRRDRESELYRKPTKTSFAPLQSKHISQVLIYYCNGNSNEPRFLTGGIGMDRMVGVNRNLWVLRQVSRLEIPVVIGMRETGRVEVGWWDPRGAVTLKSHIPTSEPVFNGQARKLKKNSITSVNIKKKNIDSASSGAQDLYISYQSFQFNRCILHFYWRAEVDAAHCSQSRDGGPVTLNCIGLPRQNITTSFPSGPHDLEEKDLIINPAHSPRLRTALYLFVCNRRTLNK